MIMSIEHGKDRIKKINRAEGNGDKGGLLKEMGLCGSGHYKQKGIRGKKEEDYQNLDELFPLHPEFP
jgi:hypothetical protein